MLTIRIEGPLEQEGLKGLIAWAEKQGMDVGIIVNTHYLGRVVGGKWYPAEGMPWTEPSPAVIEPVLNETQPIPKPGSKK